MKRVYSLLLVSLAGCAPYPSNEEIMRAVLEEQRMAQRELERERSKGDLFEELRLRPDLPAWHRQREAMALALGDRRIERPFDAVYDALLVALASVGCRVYQTERVSGYIAASAPNLPPTETAALNQAMVRDYAFAKGYPDDVLAPLVDHESEPVNVNALLGRYFGGLTLSVVRQGDAASKAKLRFSDVYYPPLIQAYYDAVWRATDKQLFLNEGLD